MGYFWRWLLLLFLAQMIVSTNESINNQSQQHSGLEACLENEYRDGGHCCKMCPPGYYVKKLCMISHTPGKCVQCPRGTYTAHANGLGSCLVCSNCHANQEAVQECSATRDRLCQCKAGYFSQDDGLSEFCTPCDECTKEQVLQPCNAMTNVVCGAPPPENNNWLYLLLLLLPLLLLLFKAPRAFCLQKCRRCKGYFSNSAGKSGSYPLIGPSVSVVEGDTNGRENTDGGSESVSLHIESGR